MVYGLAMWFMFIGGLAFWFTWGFFVTIAQILTLPFLRYPSVRRYLECLSIALRAAVFLPLPRPSSPF